MNDYMGKFNGLLIRFFDVDSNQDYTIFKENTCRMTYLLSPLARRRPVNTWKKPRSLGAGLPAARAL